METSSIVINVIMASICLLPFVLMRRNRKRTTKIMLDQLTLVADKLKCEIQQFEISQDLIIGIDKTKQFLIVVKRKADEFLSEYVDLNTVSHCKIGKQIEEVKFGSEMEKKIVRLDLEFAPGNTGQKSQKLNFYSQQGNNSLNGEIDLINKWVLVAEESLKSKTK